MRWPYSQTARITVAQPTPRSTATRATVMRAVWEYGQRILDQQWLHTNVTVLGLDETAFLAATAVSSTQFVTGLVDLAPAGGGPARLLDVVEGRSGQVVTDWLDERGPDWCAGVTTAALDPFRGYERAVRSPCRARPSCSTPSTP